MLSSLMLARSLTLVTLSESLRKVLLWLQRLKRTGESMSASGQATVKCEVVCKVVSTAKKLRVSKSLQVSYLGFSELNGIFQKNMDFIIFCWTKR